MDFSINGSELLIGWSALAALIVGLILLLRNNFRQRSQNRLNGHVMPRADRIKERNKYSGLDVFRLRPTLINLGMTLSIAGCLMAMSWTVEGEVIDSMDATPTAVFEVLNAAPPIIPPPPPAATTSST